MHPNGVLSPRHIAWVSLRVEDWKMTMPPRRPFALPTNVTITFRPEKNGRVSAHALDFDLVATGKDKKDAYRKVTLAIQSYIEFGLLNGWVEDIRYPAPDEFRPPEGTKFTVTGTIHIMSQNLLVYSASSIANEDRESAAVAR